MFIRQLTKQVIHDYDNPVVHTSRGALRGLISDEIYQFRGVTYAKAARFHRPEPVPVWEGVKDASYFDFVPPELAPYNLGGEYAVRHVLLPHSEDCLSLNIWSPSISPDAKKPVLVWLHGGGFDEGSSINHYAYDGEEMSRFGDVVVVSINHRLNVLGYLDLSAYGEEYRETGYLGQLDIIAALRWIHEEISAFGGDPDCVTIFGQSGGGAKVTTLLQMPEADGLYHRAIVMSGVFGKRAPILSAKETNGKPFSAYFAEQVLAQTGISPENICELETLPYQTLAAAVLKVRDELLQKTGKRAGFFPVADGKGYVGDPFDVGFRPETAHIPMIVGSVISEFWKPTTDKRAKDRSKYTWEESLIREMAVDEFGENADALLSAFRKTYPDKCPADVIKMDFMVRKATIAYTKLRAQTCSGPVYNYLFCHEFPDMDGTIPGHNHDIPYVFHNAHYLEPFYAPGKTERVQDMLCGAFTQFARTGNPDTALAPHWSAVTPDNGAAMLIDVEPVCRFNHDKELLALRD